MLMIMTMRYGLAVWINDYFGLIWYHVVKMRQLGERFNVFLGGWLVGN